MELGISGKPGVLHVVIAQCGITTVGKVLHMVQAVWSSVVHVVVHTVVTVGSL